MSRMHLSRRIFLGAAALGALPGCAQRTRENQLTARPGTRRDSGEPGLHPLKISTERDSLLYIPEAAKKFERAPLVLSLHGAGRNADRGIELLRSLSDQHGFLLLAPASTASTWDLEGDSRHPDVAL